MQKKYEGERRGEEEEVDICMYDPISLPPKYCLGICMVRILDGSFEYHAYVCSEFVYIGSGDGAVSY